MHGALIAEILGLLVGPRPGPTAGPRVLLEPLSRSEIRVLRYLPTHLSAPEIATELSVSTSTVRTHLYNLYAKLGAHRRPRRSTAPAPWACSPPLHASADFGAAKVGRSSARVLAGIVRIVRCLLILTVAIMRPVITGQPSAADHSHDN